MCWPRKANQEGTGHRGGEEAVPVVDEPETAIQAEGGLRIGGRAADPQRIAEAGRVLGGGDGGGHCVDGGRCRSSEAGVLLGMKERLGCRRCRTRR